VAIEISDTDYKFNFMFSSGRDDYPICRLELALFGKMLTIRLPRFIQPKRVKVIATTWDAETIKRLGRNYYFNEHERRFGAYLYENHFVLCWGYQDDNNLYPRKNYWSCFLPWNEYTFISCSKYDENGEWLETKLDNNSSFRRVFSYEGDHTVKFLFNDFDGEEIVATTTIEQRRWHKGAGWFKWLKYFVEPKIVRSLDINFSKETGRRKGSWKGGTLGHGIDMENSYELHESAFRRYCHENNMKFIKKIM